MPRIAYYRANPQAERRHGAMTRRLHKRRWQRHLHPFPRTGMKQVCSLRLPSMTPSARATFTPLDIHACPAMPASKWGVIVKYYGIQDFDDEFAW